MIAATYRVYLMTFSSGVIFVAQGLDEALAESGRRRPALLVI